MIVTVPSAMKSMTIMVESVVPNMEKPPVAAITAVFKPPPTKVSRSVVVMSMVMSVADTSPKSQKSGPLPGMPSDGPTVPSVSSVWL